MVLTTVTGKSVARLYDTDFSGARALRASLSWGTLCHARTSPRQAAWAKGAGVRIKWSNADNAALAPSPLATMICL